MQVGDRLAPSLLSPFGSRAFGPHLTCVNHLGIPLLPSQLGVSFLRMSKSIGDLILHISLEVLGQRDSTVHVDTWKLASIRLPVSGMYSVHLRMSYGAENCKIGSFRCSSLFPALRHGFCIFIG